MIKVHFSLLIFLLDHSNKLFKHFFILFFVYISATTLSPLVHFAFYIFDWDKSLGKMLVLLRIHPDFLLYPCVTKQVTLTSFLEPRDIITFELFIPLGSCYQCLSELNILLPDSQILDYIYELLTFYIIISV